MIEDRYRVEEWTEFPLKWEWSIVYTCNDVTEAMHEFMRASVQGTKVRLTDTQSKD